jgi:NAD(P)-dependent dehydrogenase (short-subunit alcohol dehydrogenase family)
MTQELDVAGRTVVVTGAASGIGRALAVHAASAGAASVIVCDLDERAAQATVETLTSVGSQRHRAFGMDVRDEERVHAVFAEVEATAGPVDVWCSNAGVHLGSGLGTDQDWDVSLSVHLRAHVNVARHVVPRMLERGEGWLLITASAAGLLSDIGSAPYTASKHAAVAFAEWLSINHDADGLTVACLCPQGVSTGMNVDRRNGRTGSGSVYLTPETVAADAFDAMAHGRFLVLPHPEVAAFEVHRAEDRERWLGGMRRLHASLTSTAI